MSSSAISLLLLMRLSCPLWCALAAPRSAPELCPSRHYAMAGRCYPCHATCAECDGGETFNCTRCGPGRHGEERFLYRNHCRLLCPLSYYRDLRAYECRHCPPHCLICSNKDRCTSCLPSYKAYGGQCLIARCHDGQAKDQKTGECVDCGIGCSDCTADTPEQCINCKDGYYFLNGHCRQVCPHGRYPDNGSRRCLSCPALCSDCSAYDSCEHCHAGAFLLENSCAAACPNGFYGDEVELRCQKCHPSCATCFGILASHCLSCTSGAILSANHCKRMSVCSHNEFLDDERGTCSPCHPSCESCSGPGRSLCLSCPDGLFLTGARRCASRCPEGYALEASHQVCKHCPRGCADCTPSGNCQRCLDNRDIDSEETFYLHQGSCLVECPEGYFESSDNGTCNTCAHECQACDGDAHHCVGCTSGMVLEEGTCRYECQPRYFLDRLGSCHRCPLHCEHCTNASACTECSFLNSLLEGRCYATCPLGHFEGMGANDGHCIPCHPSCGSCSGPGVTNCEACPPHLPRLFQGQCLAECPRGTFYGTHSADCQGCHTSCFSCTGSKATMCSVCRAGLRKDADGLCSAQPNPCPKGQFEETVMGECHPCHSVCATCDGDTAQNCLSCGDESVMYNRTCLDSCPIGHFHEVGKDDPWNAECRSCHRTCSSCHGPTDGDCEDCQDWAFTLLESCLVSCPAGYFETDNPRRCEKCDTPCRTCSGPGPNECMSCAEDSWLLEGELRCDGACPKFGYFAADAQTCRRCHPSCRSCHGVSPRDCESCDKGAKLSNDICYPMCKETYYYTDEGACEQCDSACRRCDGPGSDNCLSCEYGQALNMSSHQCKDCCPLDDTNSKHNDDCCHCHQGYDHCVPAPPPIDGGPFLDQFVESMVEPSNFPPVLLILLLALLILGVGALTTLLLYMRSHRRLCWASRHTYQKLEGRETPRYEAHRECVWLRGSTAGDVGLETESSLPRRGTHFDEDGHDDEDDIVYTGRDGTIYRKYGLGNGCESDDSANEEDALFTRPNKPSLDGPSVL
uniref:proprotein convertase subtilisin/kexin type 5-like n=1 Tax=Myxine glutinosa TaxID=7769 RepID=UPI00358E187A